GHRRRHTVRRVSLHGCARAEMVCARAGGDPAQLVLHGIAIVCDRAAAAPAAECRPRARRVAPPAELGLRAPSRDESRDRVLGMGESGCVLRHAMAQPVRLVRDGSRTHGRTVAHACGSLDRVAAAALAGRVLRRESAAARRHECCRRTVGCCRSDTRRARGRRAARPARRRAACRPPARGRGGHMSRVERTGASAVEHSGALRLATRDAPADRAPPADLPPDQASLRDLLTLARAGLHGASMRAEACGMPGFEPRGQLIRPLAALAAVPDCHATPDGFWDGALAVQLAHEASLVHDDIVDGADTRRGEATLVARRGTACALLRGDHLLTAAYCAAARTGSIEFAALFARAVERTVAGEVTQGRATGAVLTRAEYEEVALGKAGELLGCALAIAPVLLKRGDAGAVFDIGCRLGLLYQMVDD